VKSSTSVWQKIKDSLLLIGAAALLVILLPIGAGGRILGWVRGILDNGGRANDTRRDFESAIDDTKDAGDAVEESQGDIERGVELNQSAQRDNRTVRDILAEVRARGKTEKDG